MNPQLLDIAQADSSPEGLVIRDDRGMIFETIGSELWGSTRSEWGAMSYDIAYPAAVLFNPADAA